MGVVAAKEIRMENMLITRAEKAHRARRRATATMWSAIALAVALGAFLMWRGWGASSASVAAGVLLISCLVVCAWALIEERAACRLVEGVGKSAPVRADRD